MSAPAQPDLVKQLYELWLQVEDQPLYTELCMWMVGCLVNGGSIDLSVYTNSELPAVNKFIEVLSSDPLWPLFAPYVEDREYTDDDIKSLRVTCKLLG